MQRVRVRGVAAAVALAAAALSLAQSSSNTAKMLKAYIGYLLGDGQKLLPSLNYAPLPASIDQKAMAQLPMIGS
jgi:phosphate transport system substrate-binding protein